MADPTIKVPSTNNKAVDDAIAKQAQAVQESIVLATNTNTAVTELNSISGAARKVQPT